ncbi:MAG: hypothetical protein EOP48_20790 [Sphingobacteriales bacterium]|nr:MAG: hypothetical protein EOP48_20790 [Sphingobacteriales bacterium]
MHFQEISGLVLEGTALSRKAYVLVQGERLPVYSRNSGLLEPLQVSGLEQISLDHKQSMVEIITKLLESEALPSMLRLSEQICGKMEAESHLGAYHQYKRWDRMHQHLSTLPIWNPNILEGMAKEFTRMEEMIQLEWMHIKHNSQKGRRQ